MPELESRPSPKNTSLDAAEAARRVTAAEDRVRRNIAEMLHGTVQTKLLVIWYKLGQCEELLEADPVAARALLAEIRDEVSQVREEDVRQASHMLHPSIIRVGLTPALNALTEKFTPLFSVSLQVDPVVARLDQAVENRIPETVRLAAYRIVEEGLNNVYRHTRARHVQLRLYGDGPDRLAVEIADDGHGFDPSHVTFGLGLGSIAGRVDQLGGTWRIESVEGEGTVLAASLPLL